MKNCKRCGVEFIPVHNMVRYCDKCRALGGDILSGKVHDPEDIQICAQCGKEYAGRKRKYCSAECGTRVQIKRAKELRANNPPHKRDKSKTEHRIKHTHKPLQSAIYTCSYCGREYHPKKRNYKTYCSRECAYASKAKKVIEKKKRVCVICGKEFEGRSNVKYCSNECSEIRNKAQYIAQYIKRDNWRENVCVVCGKRFKAKRITAKYCSMKCYKKASGYYTSEAKREERRRYRSRKVNAYVSAVDTKIIYKRDKGICKICNKKIDYLLSYPNPMSLSMDHIIPLSCGGTHEPKNIQSAHLMCNVRKGNGYIEQGEQLRIC